LNSLVIFGVNSLGHFTQLTRSDIRESIKTYGPMISNPIPFIRAAEDSLSPDLNLFIPPFSIAIEKTLRKGKAVGKVIQGRTKPNMRCGFMKKILPCS
jgi:hypothetical protein